MTRSDGTPLRFLSYGGGTQSAALALMSAAGLVDRLDAVIFADTGGELPLTYAYAEYVGEVLDEAGIPFLTVSGGNLERALLGEEKAASSQYVVIPSHVQNEDGSTSKISRYTCSYDYKRREVMRMTKALCGPPGAWKRANVEQWLGFSTDEVGRAKPARDCRCGHVLAAHEAGACNRCRSCSAFDAWITNRFPLLELGFRRSDTIRWFGEHGHPTPPRSACWFCPNSGDARWRELRRDYPELWERAVALDERIRTSPVRPGRAFDGRQYLHRSGPLAEADLRTTGQKRADEGQDGLFDEDVLSLDCEAGVCFT